MEAVSQVVASKADSQEASISEVVAMVRVVSLAEASISEVVAMVRVASQVVASQVVASLEAAISVLNSDLDKLCVLSVLSLVFRCFVYCLLYYLVVPFISPSTVCVGLMVLNPHLSDIFYFLCLFYLFLYTDSFHF